MKKLLYILIAIMVLTSCDDYLDVKPVGKLIPSKLEEFDRLLNNSSLYDWEFLDNNGGCALAMLGDNYEYSENVFASELAVSNPNVDRLMAYKFNRPYNDPKKPDYYWDWGTYRSAYYYNNVLEGVGEFSGQNEGYAKQLAAQAKAGRAINYLNTCLIYGPAYKPGAANDTRTIPFRTSADATVKNPDLSTTQEVFDLVEEDLLAALTDIPEFSTNVRYNKISVKTALAYFYMLKGDFAKMLTYSDEAWSAALSAKGGEDGLFYDYNKFAYINNGMTSPPGTDAETVLDLQYDGGSDATFNQTTSKEIILYRRSGSMPSRSYASREFTALFSDDDMRKELFMLWGKGYANVFGGDDGIVKMYYRASKMGNSNSSGFSYPELLLMRAEAYARNGQDSDALTDLNKLREYRYKTGTAALTGLSGDDLLNEIIKERRRELPTPSYRRFLDLKRYAAYDTGKPWAKATMTHHLMTYTAVPAGETPLAPVPSGTTYTAPIDSEFYILPISNPVLLLNPHWNIPPAPESYNPS